MLGALAGQRQKQERRMREQTGMSTEAGKRKEGEKEL